MGSPISAIVANLCIEVIEQHHKKFENVLLKTVLPF